MSLDTVTLLASVVEQGREFLNHPVSGEDVRRVAEKGVDHFSTNLDLNDDKTQEVLAAIVDDLAFFAGELGKRDEPGAIDAADFVNRYTVGLAAVLALTIDGSKPDA